MLYRARDKKMVEMPQQGLNGNHGGGGGLIRTEWEPLSIPKVPDQDSMATSLKVASDRKWQPFFSCSSSNDCFVFMHGNLIIARNVENDFTSG